MRDGIVLVFIALFWCGLTGTFDFFIGRTIVQQMRAERFPTTTGRILESGLSRGSKGTTGVAIRFSYEVEGRRYESARYRFDNTKSSDSAWAKAAVRANPKGAERTVYYNPADPAEAILRPGIEGSELFMLMFLTPFNAIGLLLLGAPLAMLKNRWWPTELPGHKISRARMKTSVALPKFAPLTAVILTFVVGAFGMTFVVAFLGGGFHPSLRTVTVAWSVVFGAAVCVYIWRRVRLASGADDLVIDPGTGTVSLPLTFGRKQREMLLRADVLGVEVAEKRTRGSKGRDRVVHRVALRLRGDGRTETLVECSRAEDAERMAAWLRKELDLSA
jgi:hypothetical protein